MVLFIYFRLLIDERFAKTAHEGRKWKFVWGSSLALTWIIQESKSTFLVERTTQLTSMKTVSLGEAYWLISFHVSQVLQRNLVVAYKGQSSYEDWVFSQLGLRSKKCRELMRLLWSFFSVINSIQ